MPMTVEESRELAIRFITTMKQHCGVDLDLVTEDFEWWASYHHGVLNARQINAMCASLTNLKGLPTMEVIGVTAEPGRVAVEVKGDCQLSAGGSYQNHYHFVVNMRDGKVREIREYCDTLLASGTLGGKDPKDITRAFENA